MRTEKLLYLEAIRGVAAMIVVASHFVYAFYPEIKGTANPSAETGSFAALIGMTPIGILHDGRFAVRIFFILSGLVLSLSFFRTGDCEKAVSGAVRRYFRLTIPILAAVLLAYLLHRSNLFFNDRVAALISNGWLAPFYQFAPSVALLLREGIYGAILDFDPARTYDSVLWTMEVEFLGSMFVFGFLYLLGNSSLRYYAYVALLPILLLTGRLYTIDFLLGVILCDLIVSRNRPFPFPLWPGLLLVGTGLFFGGLRAEWLSLPGALFWDSIGAVLVIVGVACSAKLRNLLHTRCFGFLGRISFGLYLVHWPVLMSLGCGLYLLMRDMGLAHDESAFIGGGAYVVASLFSGWLLVHCADRPAIWLGHQAYNRFRRVTRPNAQAISAAPPETGSARSPLGHVG